MRSRHLIIFIVALISCGDDPSPAGQSSVNINANSEAQRYATRIEMPHLTGGNTTFIVHTAQGYDVNYAVEWDNEKRAQRWSAFMWCNQNSVTNWTRNYWKYGKSGGSFTWQGTSYPTQWQSEPFMEDPDLPSGTCSTLAMHQSNGYDRGHIVASADRLSSMETNGQTYFLTNIQPQLNAFNVGTWATMESWVRSMNERKVNNAAWRDTLWVVKGGTIDNESTNQNNGDCFRLANKDNLVVPNFFFMALLVKKRGDTTQGGYAAMGFFIKHEANNDTNLSNYAYSIDQLEERTGIDFFCNLPDNIEAQVERNYVPTVWGLKANSRSKIPY